MVTVRASLPMHGLICGAGGALTPERALIRTPGVVQAYVNPATEVAYIDYDPTRVNPKKLKAVLEGFGYETSLSGEH